MNHVGMRRYKDELAYGKDDHAFTFMKTKFHNLAYKVFEKMPQRRNSFLRS